MKQLPIIFILVICALTGCATPARVTQTAPQIDSSYTPEKDVTVNASSGWQGSGVILKKGQKIIIKTNGLWNKGFASATGPDGYIGAAGEIRHNPTYGAMALLGKVGDGEEFLVGSYLDLDVNSQGELYFRPNCAEIGFWDNSGWISASVYRLTSEQQSSRKNDNLARTSSDVQLPMIGFSLPKTNTVNRDAVAVVIGNRNYARSNADVPDVRFAHNDADLMKRYLVESLGYREGNIIVLKDAAQAQLLSTFGTKDNPKGTLYSWVRPGQSDVFVYYSGHGAPGLQDGKGYLLSVDANPATVELNGYPLDVLYQNLGKIPARSITVVVDACFSGGSEGGAVVQSASSIALRRVESPVALNNGAIFTAAGTDQVASWDKESKLGLFTRYFLEGVSGQADATGFGNQDGRVTSSELKKYLDSEVTYMARRQYLREQNPQMTGSSTLVMSTLQ